MRINIMKLLLLSTLLFSLGCSAGTSADLLDKTWPPTHKLGVSELKSKHTGLSAAHILPVIGYSVTESFLIKKKVDYTERLNLKCLEAAEKKLSKSKIFKYTSGNRESVNEDADLITFSDNKQPLKLEITFEFLLTAGWTKNIVLRSGWLISDVSGQNVVDIKTTVIGKEAEIVFPDTRDPKYEEEFIQLAAKSAEDFLLLLNGKNAKHAKESVWVWGGY